MVISSCGLGDSMYDDYCNDEFEVASSVGDPVYDDYDDVEEWSRNV